jgi:uncharacterized membrane protein SpoIIM required for sporulation
MDIDRYIARNQAGWERLGSLTARARRRVGDLSPAELEELVQLYQRASAQLSYVRTYYRDPPLTARLTRLVADASGVVYGTRPRTLRTVGRFFTTTFPAAVWQTRRFVAVAAACFVLPALLVGLWLVNDPAALDASAGPAQRVEYVENQFEQYYSEQPSAQFFTAVTTNNIRVGFVAFALGALLALPGAAVLAFNGLYLGQAAAWMTSEGDALRFWGLILPHGTLEISAIVIAGGAGLRLGWAVIAPGDRGRGQALAEEGRRAVTIVLGLMAVFVLAGILEGFVTGSGLPPVVRVVIGLVVAAAFWAYVVAKGRVATDAGFTGAPGEQDRGPRSAPRPDGSGGPGRARCSETTGGLDLEVGVGQTGRHLAGWSVDHGRAEAS